MTALRQPSCRSMRPDRRSTCRPPIASSCSNLAGHRERDGVEGFDHLGLELGLDRGEREPILHIVLVEVAFAGRAIGGGGRPHPVGILSWAGGAGGGA